MELELTLVNESRQQIHYLAGSAHARPAYMTFTAELMDTGTPLFDPAPSATLQPDGMLARLPLDPGQAVKRIVILNQFVTLEDARDAIPEGRSAQLAVRWVYHLGPNQVDGLPSAAATATGTFELTLLRNDRRLEETIAVLASRLNGDAKDAKDANGDPAGRRDAALALTSLRVPEAVMALRGLAEFPDPEIRGLVQQALREQENEPKQRPGGH